MPAHYRIYPDLALVHTRGSAVLLGAELIAHATALAADPAFSPAFSQFVDLRAVTKFAASSAEMRRLALANPFEATARRVALVHSDELFGMLRMYQMLTDSDHVRTLVTRVEAEAWAHVGFSADDLSRLPASEWEWSGEAAPR